MSWHGNAFRITGHMWGNQLVTSNDIFFVASLDKLLNKQSGLWWFEKPWGSCGISVMPKHWNFCVNMDISIHCQRDIFIDRQEVILVPTIWNQPHQSIWKSPPYWLRQPCKFTCELQWRKIHELTMDNIPWQVMINNSLTHWSLEN